MKTRYILFLILGLDALFLLLKTNELSISYYETSVLYGEFSVLQLIIKTSIFFLGQNDLALRLPMVVLHTLSALLLYKISKNYIKIQRNRIWQVLIFILLPGVMSSAIIVNEAGLIIFGLFLFVYVYENYSQKYQYILLLVYILLSPHFIYLYLSLIIFSLYNKDTKFLVFNSVLFMASLLFFGIDTHGSPRGHFMDAIGIYAAIFSPIIFVYIFYVLYRRFLTKEIDILWFISTIALLFSLLLSFRQRVNIEVFAPYLMLALPLIAQTFEHSYRVRLNMFRRKYRVTFIVSLILLFINSSVIFFNQYLYYFIQNPKKHFSYKMHIAKELAEKLKRRDIKCINSDASMTQRLKFYGVTKCSKYILTKTSLVDDNKNNVTISYKDRVVYSARVTKLNIN